MGVPYSPDRGRIRGKKGKRGVAQGLKLKKGGKLRAVSNVNIKNRGGEYKSFLLPGGSVKKTKPS